MEFFYLFKMTVSKFLFFFLRFTDLYQGERHPCPCHSAPNWPSIGLYHFGCLPGTSRHEHTTSYLVSLAPSAVTNTQSLTSYSQTRGVDDAAKRLPGRRPKLYSPSPGQPGALCHCQGCFYPLLRVNEL